MAAPDWHRRSNKIFGGVLVIDSCFVAAYQMGPTENAIIRHGAVRTCFSPEWNEDLVRLSSHGATAQHLGHALSLIQSLLCTRHIRSPHVSFDPSGEFGPEIRFTWNRTDRYLDVAVLEDGRIDWFCRPPKPGEPEGTGDEPDREIPNRFYELLRYAAP